MEAKEEAHRKFKEAVRLYMAGTIGCDEEGQALAITHLTCRLGEEPNRRKEALLRELVSGLLMNLLVKEADDEEGWAQYCRIMGILHGIES